MLDKLANVVKTASAFLQNGAVPPGTPPEKEEQLANTNHLSSKKFFLAFSGFFILGIFYAASIAILFFMQGKGELVPAYTTMYTKCMEVFATVMAVYLGGQALVDLRYNSSSSSSMSGQSNYQKTEITETIIYRAKEDDYTLEVDDEIN